MTCQRCHDEATFHLTQSIGGKSREIHLCQSCARRSGLIASAPLEQVKLDVVVQALISSQVSEQTGSVGRAACPCCGARLMDFRGSGRLGCPHEYEAFARPLATILKRHHGASRHVGKVISRRARPDPRPLLKLRARLRAAVKREDFEEAARLRDQIGASVKEGVS